MQRRTPISNSHGERTAESELTHDERAAARQHADSLADFAAIYPARPVHGHGRGQVCYAS